MANLIFQKPADQRLSSLVTITPSTEDAAYPKANLYDSNPAKAFKLNATSGNIVFDFGAAVAVDLVSIIHHNLTAGLNVRWQGNATNVWTAPTIDSAIVIPAYEQGSPAFPVNPWLDLTGIGSRSFRYWRLYFPSANAAAIQLGQLWIGASKRSLTHNYAWGYERAIDQKIIEHVTDYEVSTIYSLGAKIWQLTGDLKTSDAGALAVREWFEACNGRALPTLIIPDPAVNEARLVRWATTMQAMTANFKNDNAFKAVWRELSRGLVF